MITYIVIPVYFDTESAAEVVRDLAVAWAAGGQADDRIHITIIDNTAGRDSSIFDLNDSPAGQTTVEVIRTPYQSGHQHAILSGLASIEPYLGEGDVVVTMDGDGEDAPADALRLALRCSGDNGGPDLILAERSRRHQTTSFRTGYLIYRAVYRALTGLNMRTGNFAAMTRRTVQEVLANPLFRVSYSGSLPTIPGAARLPCARAPRIAGQSKMNTTGLIAHGLLTLIPQAPRIAARLFVLFFCALMLAVLGTATAIILRASTDITAPGWATTIVLGAALVAGIAFLGFLCGLILLATLQVLKTPLSEKFA